MDVFTEKDLSDLQRSGISKATAVEQIEKLSGKVNYSDILYPATLSHGIKKIAEDEKNELLKLYSNAKAKGRMSKFIPASGAATRMFSSLVKALNGDLDAVAKITMDNIRDMPFYNDLDNVFLFRNLDIENMIAEKDWHQIIECIVFEKGLNYANKPKALLKFTKYDNISRTALEEHIVEARALIMSEERRIRIHFTFPEDFIKQAEDIIENLREDFPSVILSIDFSVQDRTTDTIAIYRDGTLVRKDNGEPLLRPGGHGALIKNLNDQKGDIVLIKNIDNVVNSEHREISDEYNMLLSGYLLKLESKIRFFTDNIETFTYDIIEQVNAFSKEYLFTDIEEMITDTRLPALKEFIYDFLNRPIRVCGMIKNTGEPGGGPFFVRHKDGISLQIIESSQIDLQDQEKKKIFESSTHFNPVNIVCSLKDHRGRNYELNEFIDKDSYFITEKTWNGKQIRALEHPGLWNGAMSKWLTVFVEVPQEVFCPAKTVNDLLRKERFPKDLLEII